MCRIQPGPGHANNTLPPLAEVEEAPPAIASPAEGPVVNAEIVEQVPDMPDKPETDLMEADAEQHIKSIAIRAEAFAEPNDDVNDPMTENALNNVLREAEVNQEPAEVYMPKDVMETVHGEFSPCLLFSPYTI